MKLRVPGALMVALVMSGCASSAVVDSGESDRLAEMAERYVAAQFQFDQGEVRQLTAPNFVEVSPKGEVDERDEVISFYAEDKKTPAPPFVVTNQKVRITGRTAVITQVITIGKAPRTMSLSQLVTSSNTAEGWKLTSSQSTPVPPQKP